MMTSPDSVGLNDIGLTVAFTVFTSQAMYYKETNVQAYIAQQQHNHRLKYLT